MAAEYFTLTQAGQAEEIIKKSRFVCAVAPIRSEDEAQAFIARIRAAHPKATHHVPVYMLGDDDHIQRANDDGEPSGTAGVPMLRTLQEMGLHDVAAVTTRYFGGIKLGAGGLIRAYAGSVTAAVQAAGISRRVAMRQMTLTVPYPQLDRLTHWLEGHHITISASDYQAVVALTIAVPETEADPVAAGITELTAGQVTPTRGPLTPLLVPQAR
ncbi:YigZ family protein [Lacticaseibacillus jixianensis]|uniref:YigZ family protein n=1 Tax=Lacticaseibacillus jixianensis TaxID=2486012 RepID=A0ABW4B5H2_9LACO|nr:YigZ family protein [Lacticaseibacillus jixianensis]